MVFIEKISKFEGKEVEIRGWLYNKRSSGKIIFLIIRDGTGIIQGVVTDETPEAFKLSDKITQESSIVVKGIVRKEKRATGGYELSIKDIQLLSLADEYPIGKKEHGIDFLLSKRHLWVRSRIPFAVLRIRTEVISAIRDFFDNRGFILFDSPLLTPSACEGVSTLFEVPYFDKKAYLSQSGQLYVEAGCMAFGKVYCFGPTFRAEKSKTRRHLTEFWQVEPEVAFAHLEDAMVLAEQLVTYIVERVLEKKKPELEILERDITPLEKIKTPFPRITYKEALGIIQKGDVPQIDYGEDFGAPQETYLSNQFDRPVFVHHYPAKCKAFYMKRDGDLSLCADLLATEGYGEIIGGSEREDDLETLKKRIKEFDLNEKDYEWYLDLRRYGSVPHSGFGLGLERTIAWICNLSHTRETIPFPRTIDRLSP